MRELCKIHGNTKLSFMSLKIQDIKYLGWVMQIFHKIILVHLGCCNRNTRCLNDTHLFLMVLETGKLRSRCWQIWVWCVPASSS